MSELRAMDADPGKIEHAARAHEMRLMRDQGVPLESIAALYHYHVTTIQLMINWHETQYPDGADFDGACADWQAFNLEYLVGGKLQSPPEPRVPKPESSDDGNPLIDLKDFFSDDPDDEDDD